MRIVIACFLSTLAMSCTPQNPSHQSTLADNSSSVQSDSIRRVLPYGFDRRGGTSILFDAVKYYAAKRQADGRPLSNVLMTEESTGDLLGIERLSIVDGLDRLECQRTFQDTPRRRAYGLNKCEVSLERREFEASTRDDAMATILYKSLSSYAATLRSQGQATPFVVNRSKIHLNFGNDLLDSLTLQVYRGVFRGHFDLQVLNSPEDIEQLSEEQRAELIEYHYELHPQIEAVTVTAPIGSFGSDDEQIDGFYKAMKQILESEIYLDYPSDQIDWPYAVVGGLVLEAVALRLNGQIVGGSIEARQYGCAFDDDADSEVWESEFPSRETAREAGCDPEADVSWAGRAVFFGDLSIASIDSYMEWTGH